MSNVVDVAESAARPLRLACLIDDLGTGGAQRIVTVLGRQCQGRAGIELMIVSLGTRSDEVAGLVTLGIRVHQLPAGRVLSISRTQELARILKAFRPDVIHTHLLSAHILGGLCGALLRVPVVSTLHNIDPHPRFAGTWKRRAESLCLRHLAQRCLAVGPTVASSNARRLGRQRIDVLANPLSFASDALAEPGVNAGLHKRQSRAQLVARFGLRPEARLFLTVGRLSAEKGWPEFLSVFERLRVIHPECHLVSVGDGPLQASLSHAIGVRDLASHVTLCGRQNDMAGFYGACDAFVLNSTIEGLPMALLEAMAAGLPVVSTRVGDVEYALGDTAVALVNPGDTNALVDALGHCHERWDESVHRGQAGPARVAALFNVDSWVQRLWEIYREVGPPAALPATGKTPLHLVEMVDSLSSGGAQSLLQLRARHAAGMGYRIDVIALRKTDRAAVLIADGVTEVHEFASPHVFDPARIMGICSLLRRLRPDVIHTHLRTSNTVGAMCGRLVGIPVVSTLHSIYPEPARAHARRDWAEKWALRLFSSHITAVGPAVRDTHSPRFGGKPVVTVPNPVELPHEGGDPVARRSRLRLAGVLPFAPPEALVVLSAARLTGLKGLHHALEVVEKARVLVPELHYCIAGEGEQRISLEAHIHAHDMGDYVTLLGHSDHVRDLMGASDLFLLTSTGEGLPLVLLEAMAMHLPIVATRVGDVPWLLQEGDLGVLVEPGDLKATVQAVHHQLTCREAAAKRAQQAFETVSRRYSVSTWLQAIDQTYRRAIASQPATVQPTTRTSTPPASPSAKHRNRIDA